MCVLFRGVAPIGCGVVAAVGVGKGAGRTREESIVELGPPAIPTSIAL